MKGVSYSADFGPKLEQVIPALIHLDVAPSNILVNGDNGGGLIDWEFAKFSDPMAEFSTVFYDDMEYNNGKWCIQITDKERTALLDGYQKGGGEVYEQA